jgi:putative transposase
VKYAWVKDNSDSFPVAAMCRAFQVSKSGYYRWLKAEPSLRTQRSERIRSSIKQVYEESNQIYGSYKIADQLKKDDRLEAACRNTVASAMREMGLKSRVAKKFTPTTTVSDPSKIPAPNILDQTFTAAAPNQKWVTDITYLPTQLGWVYLAVVLDLFSRKVVGWSVSESLATPLVSTTLRNAIEARRPDTKSLLHHSDRGSQYTSDDYQQTLRTLNITCSMSRPRSVLRGMLLRQRCHGTFLLVTQTRVDQVRRLCRYQSSQTQRLPVHRNLLQLEENSPDSRLQNT